MRFHYGAVPEDPTFDPQADGWRGIREPGPVALQILAIPVALATLALLGMATLAIAPGLGGSKNQVRLTFGLPEGGQGGWAGLGFFLLNLLVLLAGMLVVIFIHELVHALLMPDGGRSPRTLIAVWPEKLLFYAYHLGALTRNRFLLVFAGPLLALTGLPLVLLAILAPFPGTIVAQGLLAGVALFNGASACGDIIGFWLVLLQIPANALVRNQGWRSYWKTA